MKANTFLVHEQKDGEHMYNFFKIKIKKKNCNVKSILQNKITKM